MRVPQQSSERGGDLVGGNRLDTTHRSLGADTVPRRTTNAPRGDAGLDNRSSGLFADRHGWDMNPFRRFRAPLARDAAAGQRDAVAPGTERAATAARATARS